MIIGELINSSRKAIKPLVEGYDAEALIAIGQTEAAAGAEFIDLNCGTFVHDEAERLTWLVEKVGNVLDMPLCLDSPDPRALRAALPLVKNPVMINSISAEEERFADILPLALEYQAKLVALCMDGDSIPQTAEARYAIGSRLIDKLTNAGMLLSDIYLDPMVQPVSVSKEGAQVILETVRKIRAAYPEVNCVCGLSNISFGLPNRKIINRYFLAQAVAAGMDSFILDPTDRQLMGCYLTARMLAGGDKAYTKDYLKAHRQGLFDI